MNTRKRTNKYKSKKLIKNKSKRNNDAKKPPKRTTKRSADEL